MFAAFNTSQTVINNDQKRIMVPISALFYLDILQDGTKKNNNPIYPILTAMRESKLPTTQQVDKARNACKFACKKDSFAVDLQDLYYMEKFGASIAFPGSMLSKAALRTYGLLSDAFSTHSREYLEEYSKTDHLRVAPFDESVFDGRARMSRRYYPHVSVTRVEPLAADAIAYVQKTIKRMLSEASYDAKLHLMLSCIGLEGTPRPSPEQRISLAMAYYVRKGLTADNAIYFITGLHEIIRSNRGMTIPIRCVTALEGHPHAGFVATLVPWVERSGVAPFFLADQKFDLRMARQSQRTPIGVRKYDASKLRDTEMLVARELAGRLSFMLTKTLSAGNWEDGSVSFNGPASLLPCSLGTYSVTEYGAMLLGLYAYTVATGVVPTVLIDMARDKYKNAVPRLAALDLAAYFLEAESSPGEQFGNFFYHLGRHVASTCRFPITRERFEGMVAVGHKMRDMYYPMPHSAGLAAIALVDGVPLVVTPLVPELPSLIEEYYSHFVDDDEDVPERAKYELTALRLGANICGRGVSYSSRSLMDSLQMRCCPIGRWNEMKLCVLVL
jgi:hypothetical protein